MNYTRAALLHDIPEVVSPDLLEALAAMGRGDKIVLANLNFPAASTCRGPERPLLVRADGHRTADLLEAIVKLLPVENEVFTDYYIILLLQTTQPRHKVSQCAISVTIQDRLPRMPRHSPVVAIHWQFWFHVPVPFSPS